MGNCIETCRSSPQQIVNPCSHGEDQIKPEFIKGNNNLEKNRGNNMRIKIVLTKEELEWLLTQLKNTEGKRLEDVLEEIHRSRGKAVGGNWKPCLDSITESPEVPDCMDR